MTNEVISLCVNYSSNNIEKIFREHIDEFGETYNCLYEFMYNCGNYLEFNDVCDCINYFIRHLRLLKTDIRLKLLITSYINEIRGYRDLYEVLIDKFGIEITIEDKVIITDFMLYRDHDSLTLDLYNSLLLRMD